MEGTVFDIKRYAIHDGPGIRTTVFFKGCPLACPWCHNPESRDPRPQISWSPARCLGCDACREACPTGALRSRDEPADDATCLRCGACARACPSEARAVAGCRLSVTELIAAVARDRVFYEDSGGGVTFSGGEPLMQPAFLQACLEACRAQGIHTAVDTSGYADRETLLSIAPLVDLFLYDVKLIDPERHERHVGVPSTGILGNLRALSEAGGRIWVRFPLIPDVNDDAANVTATARLVKSLAPSPPVQLLPYHRIGGAKYRRLGMSYEMGEAVPPNGQRVAAVAQLMAGFGLEVKTGG
jgi:pyruvate formate lyase activating enzyme